MSGKTKLWYTKWWGILLAIGGFGLFIPWYVWTKTDWHKGLKLGIALVAFFAWAAMGSGDNSTSSQPQKNASEQTVVVATSNDQAGKEQAQKTEPTPESPKPTVYEVTGVVDGDTIKLSIDGKTETLRLIGIDTPETVDPRKPVQCFGKEASNKMNKLVSSKKVSLEADSSAGERDKYDRLLRYVFLEDGTHVNKLLVSEGYAHEYTYSLPYKYQEEFIAAEKEAREQKKGLWADDACASSTTGSSNTSNSSSSSSTESTSSPAPASSSSNCDPNYSPCIPKYPPDLDCGDIGFPVKVIGSDPHKLDRDKDGQACEG